MLDAGAGAGADAAWLLRAGFQVVALDASAGMLTELRRRAPEAEVAHVRLEEAGSLWEAGSFDGALLDFGVVNLLDLSLAAASLARLLRPGAPALVVAMPRIAPAFVLSALAHGRLSLARARLSSSTAVGVEGAPVWTRYPSAAELMRAFSPWFELEERQALGALMPPPGSRWPAEQVGWLARLEAPLRGLPGLRHLGDHVLHVLRRKEGPPGPGGPAHGWLGRRRLAARTRLQRTTGGVKGLEVLVLELTRGCQSRCVGCDHRGPAGGEALDADRAVALLTEARAMGCREVVLTGGEPLLRPDLELLLPALRGIRIPITLLTNGLALERHAALVCRSVDRVVISLDGQDAAAYRAARGVDGLRAVERGVRALRLLRPELPLTARVTVGPHNVESLVAIAEKAREMGLHGVSFLAADRDHEGAFGRQGVPSLAPLGPARARSAVAALRAAVPRPFLLDSDAALDRIVALAESAAGGPSAGAPRCDAPWTSAVVEADLRLRPCFFLPSTANVEGGLRTGLLAARPALARIDPARSEICARCVCWAKLT